jgi:anti-sigma regulatory factor (Ser/Thr protein kinase)
VEPTTVSLRFSPLPVHVRTARLVAAAVARRSGVDEEVLDEVRLAVGEASSRAVDLHQANCPGEPVVIRITDGGTRLTVEVVDHVPNPNTQVPEQPGEALDRVGTVEAEMLDEGRTARDQIDDQLAHLLGLAVIEGLVDDVEFEHQPEGLVLRMSWPLGPPPSSGGGSEES